MKEYAKNMKKYVENMKKYKVLGTRKANNRIFSYFHHILFIFYSYILNISSCILHNSSYFLHISSYSENFHTFSSSEYSLLAKHQAKRVARCHSSYCLILIDSETWKNSELSARLWDLEKFQAFYQGSGTQKIPSSPAPSITGRRRSEVRGV